MVQVLDVTITIIVLMSLFFKVNSTFKPEEKPNNNREILKDYDVEHEISMIDARKAALDIDLNSCK